MLFPLVHERSVAHVHVQHSLGNCHHRLQRVLATSTATISSQLFAETQTQRKLRGNRNSLAAGTPLALVAIKKRCNGKVTSAPWWRH